MLLSSPGFSNGNKYYFALVPHTGPQALFMYFSIFVLPCVLPCCCRARLKAEAPPLFPAADEKRMGNGELLPPGSERAFQLGGALPKVPLNAATGCAPSWDLSVMQAPGYSSWGRGRGGSGFGS